MTRRGTTNRKTRADLYRWVFDTKALQCVIFLMMLFFLLQPVMPAFASEFIVAESGESGVADAAADTSADDLDNESEAQTAEEVVPEELAAAVTTDPVVEDVPATDTSASEVVSPGPLDTSEDGTQSTDAHPELPGSATGTTSEAVASSTTGTSGAGGDDEVTEAAPVVTEEAPSEDAEEVTTTPAAEQVDLATTTTVTTNVVGFQKSDCVAMGSGAYQCFDRTELTKENTALDFEVFAKVDEDGDQEIFVRHNDAYTQLTHNRVDDTAPAFDPIKNAYVWQRYVDDVSTIVLYQNGEESTISQVGINSVEPRHSDGVTVWQAWIGNNWEIVMYDGEDLVQLTTSPEHDIAPSVQLGYVTWSSVGTDGQLVRVYNLKTQAQNVITDGDAARTENPRFVMVYDATYENGDVITKGFNPETGELMLLAAQPAPEPIDIPPADQTGETRAMLQNKSSSRDDFNDVLDDLEQSTATSSATTTGTNALGATTTLADLVVATTTAPALPLTDFDLIVEPYVGSSSAATSSVE